MNSVLVSIIIPTFNRAIEIQTAIKSVITQTYSNWECIIVDDGSTDDSFSILDSFSSQDQRIKFVKRNRLPKGAPTCRNIGLSMAKGDYILFLDSDDYLLPHCLEQRINKVIEFPDNDFLVFPMGELVDHVVKKREIPRCNDYLIPFLSANLPWQITSPIWKKRFLESLIGFSEGYPRFNDPELMIRALVKSNNKFVVFNYLDFDAVYVRDEKSSIKFKYKVYKSLTLFIPDIVNYLEKNNKKESKILLSNYLHFWFKYIYIPSKSRGIRQSLVLIVLFYKQGILTVSKSLSLITRLLVYVISSFVFKNPIDKLSSKLLYNSL